jgi:dTMP kinase
MFITFEGVEGSGKSTHMRRLARHLEGRGCSVVMTYEPGGTPGGDAIRGILLDPSSDLQAGAELFLMMASRRELVDRVIRPALAEGKFVLSDRFLDASFAYQGYGRGLPLDMVEQLGRWACREIKPDLTILFDVDPAEGLQRSLRLEKKESPAGQADRIEAAGLEFMHRVRRGYLELAQRQPDRFRVIPVTEGLEQTYSKMIHSIDNLIM